MKHKLVKYYYLMDDGTPMLEALGYQQGYPTHHKTACGLFFADRKNKSNYDSNRSPEYGTIVWSKVDCPECFKRKEIKNHSLVTEESRIKDLLTQIKELRDIIATLGGTK